MNEFMGLIKGQYEAKQDGGFLPGTPPPPPHLASAAVSPLPSQPPLSDLTAMAHVLARPAPPLPPCCQAAAPAFRWHRTPPPLPTPLAVTNPTHHPLWPATPLLTPPAPLLACLPSCQVGPACTCA